MAVAPANRLRPIPPDHSKIFPSQSLSTPNSHLNLPNIVAETPQNYAKLRLLQIQPALGAVSALCGPPPQPPSTILFRLPPESEAAPARARMSIGARAIYAPFSLPHHARRAAPTPTPHPRRTPLTAGRLVW